MFGGRSMEYKISYIGDECINEVHHIGIDFNGNHYNVILGRYINGGFCSIPNLEVGCELSSFTDIFWNTESLGKVLKGKKVATVIAMAIAEFG